MSKQHLDLLALPPRGAIGLSLCDVAGQVPGALMDAAWHLACRLLGTAARLEASDLALVLASAIHELFVVYDRALAGQHLAILAKVDVALVVISVVLAREGSIAPF